MVTSRFSSQKRVPCRVTLLVVSLFLIGCAALSPIGGGKKVDMAAPLISREILFGNPDKVNPQISPDGTRLAYLAPVDGVLNVWVGPADDPAAARPVTDDRKRGIWRYFWTYTADHLVYLQDKEGDENWRVYVLDLAKGETRDLTPLEGVRAEIKGVSHKHPEEILVGLNDRNPQLHDVYRFNLKTGERILLQQNAGFADIVSDDDYNVRFALRMMPSGGAEVVKMTEGGEWDTYMTIEMEDIFTTNLVGFDKTGKSAYMVSSRGRDTAALMKLDIESGELTLIEKRRGVRSIFLTSTFLRPFGV